MYELRSTNDLGAVHDHCRPAGSHRAAIAEPVQLMWRDDRFWGPDRAAECPCGSHHPTLVCHGRADGSWRAEPWKPSEGPPTGHINQGCFAGPLRDCSPELSGEHFVVSAVRAASGGRPLLSGLSLPAGPHGPHPGRAGVRPVLCVRHQHALTSLDCEAARAYAAIRRFHAPPGQRRLELADDVELLSGPLLEAWVLKTCFGPLAAQTPVVDTAPTTWRTDAETVLLDVLFRGASWPTGWGLWHTPTAATTDLRVGPFHADGRPWGPVAELGPLPLQLLLGPPGIPDAVHRPGGLVMMHEHSFRRQMLLFGWPDGTGGSPIITLALAPTEYPNDGQ